MKNVPQTWKDAWAISINTLMGYKTLDEISREARCSAWVPIAFRALGYIEKNKHGYYFRTDGTRSPNWRKVKEWIDKKHAANTAPKSPTLPLDSPQENTVAPIAPTLRQNCDGEKQYTKAEAIAAFKAFYIREYEKMDDRAYTLCGFLLTALDEAL